MPERLRPAVAFMSTWVGSTAFLIGLWIGLFHLFGSFHHEEWLPEEFPSAAVVPVGASLIGLIVALLLRGRERRPLVLVEAATMDALTSEIDQAYQQRQWDVVLRFGRVIMRPLWIAGRYKTLKRVGAMIEDAAAQRGQPRDQAIALMDALGWTLYKLGETDAALSNIRHAISVASDPAQPDLLSKAYRHLSGIAMDQGNLGEAREHLQKSADYATSIPDEHEKKLAQAGLELAYGLLLGRDDKFDDALTRLKAAQAAYKGLGDEDRNVKMYQYIAQVQRRKGSHTEALDTYRRGLEAALVLQRKDAIAENALGAAELYHSAGEKTRAGEAYLTAAQAFGTLGLDGPATACADKATALLSSANIKGK